MIKIKYIFDFLIFSLKRRYFGYKKTIVLGGGGSPSIEALSPLLEDINNCEKKNKKKKNKKKNRKKNKKQKKQKKTAIFRKLQGFGGSYF